MRFIIDAAKLHQIAHHNRGTFLGFLARRFAAEQCAITLEEPEMAALARNHPEALGALLFQTTFAPGAESAAWEFNISSDWKSVAEKDPRILYEMIGKAAEKTDFAQQVQAYHAPKSGISVYWLLGPAGLNTIFHSSSFAIQNDDRDKKEKWKFIDLDATIPNQSDYNDHVAQGINTPPVGEKADRKPHSSSRQFPELRPVHGRMSALDRK